MKVHELIEWLKEFKDQEADVEVVCHKDDGDYCHSKTEIFNPDLHVEYTDLRGNPHIKDNAPYFNSRSLLLGVYRG